MIGAAYLVKLSHKTKSSLAGSIFWKCSITEGASIERDDAGNPGRYAAHRGTVPRLPLHDTAGKLTTFEHLLADHKPSIVFVGPKCDPCKALLPDFAEWRVRFNGKIRLVFVSSGTPEENRPRFGEDLSAGMLIQSNSELGNKVHCKWTPTALFVSADGNIASHPAVGEGAMRDLFDRLEKDKFEAAHFHMQAPRGPGRIKIGHPVPDMKLEELIRNSSYEGLFQGWTNASVFPEYHLQPLRGRNRPNKRLGENQYQRDQGGRFFRRRPITT